MATSLQIPMAEYLETEYRPDREFVDGEVRERSVGKFEHARVQTLLAQWFGLHQREWNLMAVTEWRVQVSPGRVRIPDVLLIRPGAHPDVLQEPPLLIVEVLSPDDSYTDLEQRTRDYLEMGVRTVWLIDPYSRTGRICRGESWTSAERLEVEGTAVFVELAALFADING